MTPHEPLEARRRVSVTLTDYALVDEVVPTLPLVVEVRRLGGSLPAVTGANRLDSRRWTVTVALDPSSPVGRCVAR